MAVRRCRIPAAGVPLQGEKKQLSAQRCAGPDVVWKVP